MKKIFIVFFISFLLAIFIGVFYLQNPQTSRTRIFSNYTLLTSSWEKYKTKFINKDGRVIDYSQNSFAASQGDITTSEAQSYALLRSVWIDDKKTFDLVWNWTKNNLKRPKDHLFGWKWGKRPDKTYGFLPDGGVNSASDADSDIALALLLAAKRWNIKEYLNQAQLILPDLWKIETDIVNGKRYLLAGNWAKTADRDILNPSYFSPYAWRLFAKVDQKNDWESLIGPAYELLKKSGTEPLDKAQAAGLPPDWLSIRRDSGQIEPPHFGNLTTNYSYDAIRIPWRIGLDYFWHGEKRAKDYLATLDKLYGDYKQNGKLPGSYSHDGTVLNQNEVPAVYATSLGYFLVIQPLLAKEIYEEKILKLYSNDTNSFKQDLPYYEENWLWFGAALYLWKNQLFPAGK